ncbi:MAG: hypothetical protein AAFO77_01285, partial [Pseudomonadota bacterium]
MKEPEGGNNPSTAAPASGAASAFSEAEGVHSRSVDTQDGVVSEASQSPSGRPSNRKRRRNRRRKKPNTTTGQQPAVFAADNAPRIEPEAPKSNPKSTPSSKAKPGHSPTQRFSPQPPQLYAALDLGTNNCRLLIATPTRPGQFRVVDAFSRIVRLGEGLGASGRLSDNAMDRALEALAVCSEKLG